MSDYVVIMSRQVFILLIGINYSTSRLACYLLDTKNRWLIANGIIKFHGSIFEIKGARLKSYKIEIISIKNRSYDEKCFHANKDVDYK